MSSLFLFLFVCCSNVSKISDVSLALCNHRNKWLGEILCSVILQYCLVVPPGAVIFLCGKIRRNVLSLKLLTISAAPIKFGIE
ncbi:hypothetical protein CW304_07095 [Bacillus sp. UFRGS-B20]|nr:hypothetical protein CW304_07095 [Bacillus sp. UFRGS-B20]